MTSVYIVDILRTPVGKAPRGVFRQTLPDDLLAHCIRTLTERHSEVDWQKIEDVIIGCAMPEGEQGMNVARIASLLAGLPDTVPGMTLNRFCSSGLQSIATAAGLIRQGAPFALAGGVESMSMVPLGGNKYTVNPSIFNNENVAIAYGMGITAENVAEQWKITREEQDHFAAQSHEKAVAAQKRGDFEAEIAPFEVVSYKPDLHNNSIKEVRKLITQDEGPRADTSYEMISKLRPVFALKGRADGYYLANLADSAPFVFLRAQLATFGVVFGELALIAEPGVLRGRRFGNAVLVAAHRPVDTVALTRLVASDAFPARLEHGLAVRDFIGGARPVRDEDAVPSPQPPDGAFGIG